MDNVRFDRWTKTLSRSRSRRGVLAGLAGDHGGARFAAADVRRRSRLRVACAAGWPVSHAPTDSCASTIRAIVAIPPLVARIAPESASHRLQPLRGDSLHRGHDLLPTVRRHLHSQRHSMLRRPMCAASRAIRRCADPASTAAMRAAVSVWVLVRYARTNTARRSSPRASRVVQASAERASIAATKAAVSALRLAAVASSSSVNRPVRWVCRAARRSAHRARSVATRAAASAPRPTACAS